MLSTRRLVIVIMVTLLPILASFSRSERTQFQTRIAQTGQTVIAEAGSMAETHAARFKDTAEARIATEAESIKGALTSNRSQITITPPYDVCVGKSTQVASPLTGTDEILEKGFGSASYSCNAETGSINNTVLLFGGKDGSILEPPNYEADVSSGMELDFTPSSTGDLRVDVTLSVNSNTGAAAGSATALLDLRDVMLEFLLPTQIGAFVEIAKSLILQTAAGVKTEAYIYVDTETSRDETTALVGGRGFGASFPIPPNSQSAEFSSEKVQVFLTTPVTQGEKLYIGTGISTTARAHGWAVAYWNPGRKQETFVVSIVLTEESASSNDSTVISNPDFRILQPGQSDEIVFDIQNTGNTTWMSRQGYALINTNDESLGASPKQNLISEVLPRQVARWIIPITAPSQAGLYWTRWQMAHNEEPFGSVVSCLLIVVPEKEGISIDLGSLLEEWLNSLIERIITELNRFWENLQRQIEEWFQRELERLWREFWESLFRQCCGANAVAPAALLLSAWSIHRKWRRRRRDSDRD